MIYLNNAATTYPKPQRVLETHAAALADMPGSDGRSTLVTTWHDVMEQCRRSVAAVLGSSRPDRIFFTSGATDSVNRIVCGLPLGGVPVFITQTEHNSVLRPLYNNEKTAGNITVIPCDGTGRVSPDSVEAAVRRTGLSNGGAVRGLLIVNHCSNVTGCIQDIAAMSGIAHRHGMLFMTDTAQSAGTMPVDIDATETDIAVFTGHKGLFGVPGTGGYYIREGLPLRPVVFGGTGRNSKQTVYQEGQYEYEAGTQNLPGIAALNAGAEHILKNGIAAIEAEERRKMSLIRSCLSSLPAVTVYGGDAEHSGPLLSFNVRSMTPDDVGYVMMSSYGITLRTGIHCSPLIHKALGTYEHGTVRVSISCLTPDADIEAFNAAVSELAECVQGTHPDDMTTRNNKAEV